MNYKYSLWFVLVIFSMSITPSSDLVGSNSGKAVVADLRETTLQEGMSFCKDCENQFGKVTLATRKDFDVLDNRITIVCDMMKDLRADSKQKEEMIMTEVNTLGKVVEGSVENNRDLQELYIDLKRECSAVSENQRFINNSIKTQQGSFDAISVDFNNQKKRTSSLQKQVSSLTDEISSLKNNLSFMENSFRACFAIMAVSLVSNSILWYRSYFNVSQKQA